MIVLVEIEITRDGRPLDVLVEATARNRAGEDVIEDVDDHGRAHDLDGEPWIPLTDAERYQAETRAYTYAARLRREASIERGARIGEAGD